MAPVTAAPGTPGTADGGEDVPVHEGLRWSQAPSLALTGVTGYLGGLVARHLAARGVPLRLLARRPEAVADLPGAQVLPASYADTDQVRAALVGTRVLLMVSAHEAPERVAQHCAFVDAAVAAGVEHIVYTSFYGASTQAAFTLSRDHALTEKHIRACGVGYTFLRDNFYTDFFVSLCTQGGEIRGPAGAGRCSAVTRDDVARVAAEVLTRPDLWASRVLDLTGPQDLGMEQIAAAVSARLGRGVVYVEETVDEAYASRLAWPAQQWEYDAWVSTYTAIRDGEQAGVSPDVEQVLGRQPESLEQYLDRVGL